MRRVSVVGTSCSGKTTLSRVLARRLGVPWIELDALFWGPDWTPPADEDFRARVRDAIAGDAWVCDGNYSVVRDVVQPRADTLVWLDLPFVLVLARTVRRSVGRAVSREEYWSGNVEHWRRVVGRDSLIWWVVTTHRSRRKHWEAWLQQPAATHLSVFRLRSRRAVREWLATVRPVADEV
jgi:adenylate kinase family enzyme